MENWKQIPAAPAYEVSDAGRVRRPLAGKRGHKPHVLKNSRDRNGYAVVNLTLPEGTQSKMYVHRLVAEAFIDNPMALPQVAHFDGDGMNAEASNLRWVTQSDNEQDKKRHGRYNKAQKGSRTFAPDQVAEIRTLHEGGMSINAIAKQHGVGFGTIKNALVNGAA